MTHYDFLLTLKSEGVLQTLCREYGFPSHYVSWMEYYEFYLAHRNQSYREISYSFSVTKSTIERAVAFMKAPHISSVP